MTTGPRLIDVKHLGRPRVIACWQVGDLLIDPGPASCLPALLEALGDERPRALLLTHIHLDHAGASGSLVERWPELEVHVHERGVRHMADPSRLLESARRLYGDDMDRLWGEVLPVPESNLRVLRGGETLDPGFEVAYTPGHASHHVSYLYEGTAFVGDVGGVRIMPSDYTLPPTPPPDIDVEAWHESIERIAAWRPERLAMTHFGATEDVAQQLEVIGRRLAELAELARSEDLETFVVRTRAEIARAVGSEAAPAYEQAAPPDQLYAGLERYWRKQAEHDDLDRSGARSSLS
jgi:glyoxylase-like metal-dependent hydrolase (beta-lactamase superfamily II)